MAEASRPVYKKLVPACLRDSDSVDGLEEASDDTSRLDLVDEELGEVHRDIMAKTSQKYLVMDASSFPDKMFTGTLIVLTMLGILTLFWYQNFGPGFHFKHVKY